MSKHSRRSFITKLSGTAAAFAMPSFFTRKEGPHTAILSRQIPEPVQQQYAANDQLQIALIGAGGMGGYDAETAISHPGVKLVAACDLYEGRLTAAKEKFGKDIFTTRDYREVLNRKDIDAVIVATPDHWHQQITIDALAAGKAVYCEKPMVHSLSEGPAVIQAQYLSNKTFQVGSQGMSSLGNEKAKELYEAGAIGKLNYAEGFWARNSPGGAWQYDIPKDASKETVDWDRFLHDLPKRDFDPVRFFRWRNYRDYGTGVSGDLFVHLFSSLHFIVSSLGPNQIYASGGLRHWMDGREVPDVMLGIFDYPETHTHPAFNLSLRVNFVDGTSGNTYLRLVGDEGAMDVEWEKVTLRKNKSYPSKDSYFTGEKDPNAETYGGGRKEMLPPPEMVYKAENDYKGAHYDHFFNFLQGVRNGGRVTEDAIFGYRAAAPALICNNSYFDKSIVQWDPVKMSVM